MEKYKVSVIIPCYNVERYIDESLDSICRQTFNNLEIICVDDGSTDNTCKIIEHRILKDNRIKLFRQEHMYAGVARNRGIEQSTGEYLCFLDSDDFFEEDMIETLMQSAVDNNSEIVLCDAYFIDDKTKEITEPLWVLNHKILQMCSDVFSYKDIPDYIFEVCWSVPWNKLYKKAFIEKHNLCFQSVRRHNDEYFVSISLVLANRISYVKKRLVYYRRNLDNSLQAYADQQEKEYDFYYALTAIKEKLKKINVYSEVKNCFLDKCLLAGINLLKRQKNIDAYERLYNFLKNRAFKGLDISTKMETKYPSYLKEYKTIMNYNLKEYLFRKLNEQELSKYIFPYEAVGKSNRIALYAAGKVGKEYYKQLIDNERYCIAAWFDNNFEMLKEKGLPVANPRTVGEYDFEKIVIAVEREFLYKEIKEQLMNSGVAGEKIIWRV